MLAKDCLLAKSMLFVEDAGQLVKRCSSAAPERIAPVEFRIAAVRAAVLDSQERYEDSYRQGLTALRCLDKFPAPPCDEICDVLNNQADCCENLKRPAEQVLWTVRAAEAGSDSAELHLRALVRANVAFVQLLPEELKADLIAGKVDISEVTWRDLRRRGGADSTKANEEEKRREAERKAAANSPLDETAMSRKIAKAFENEYGILFLHGTNIGGDKFWVYLKVSIGGFKRLKAALTGGEPFSLVDYGEVLAAGKGDVPKAVEEEIARKYPNDRIEPAELPARK